MPKTIKEITVFAHGDPRAAATWSNVPRCIVNEMERRGIIVHTVDLLCYPLQTLYDNILRRLFRLILLPFSLRPPYYVHTRLHHWWGERKIQRTQRRFPTADYCLFIGYLFHNHYDDTPSMLLGDWPIHYDLRRKGQPCTFLYNRVIRQEHDAIIHATYLVSLFSIRAREIRNSYPTSVVHFLGNAFVNNCYEKVLCSTDIIRQKSRSNILLFIGKADRYRAAAQLLIDALKLLHHEEHYRHLQLHIIGMEQRSLRVPPSLPVVCHGYLHKDRPSENHTYYRLLIDARMIINPSLGWAAYSSLVEAMYFYTPVIVTPFDAFTDTFGKDIDFGCYTTGTITDLTSHIRYLCDTSHYPTLCERAHERVKYHTCPIFVNKMIQLMQR